MVFTKISQLKKFATYAEPFDLFSRRYALPLGFKIIAAHFSSTATGALRIYVIQKIVVFAEVGYFLLQVVNGAIKVVSALLQHVESLIATRLVVQNDNNQIAVDLLAV